MNIKHLILEQTSLDDLSSLLDANAKNGYKTVSLASCFSPRLNGTLYTAIMVKYDNGDISGDILVQIYNKLNSIDTTLMYIDSNTQT